MPVGVSFEMQQRAIRSGVHILVATPGRALDHISRGTIDLSNVRHVVLDEVSCGPVDISVLVCLLTICVEWLFFCVAGYETKNEIFTHYLLPFSFSVG